MFKRRCAQCNFSLEPTTNLTNTTEIAQKPSNQWNNLITYKEKKIKKKILTIACCAVLLSISTPAYSGDGLYVSGDIGAGILSDSEEVFNF